MIKKKPDTCRKVSSLMRKLQLAAVILCAMMAVTSCSDDPSPFSPDSSLEETETGQISSFSVETGHFYLTDDLTDINIVLISDDGEVASYKGEAERKNGLIRFKMEIPEDETLPQGKYVMTLNGTEGGSFPGRLMVTFSEGRLVSAIPVKGNYPLKGSGTVSDPYIINSEEDFSIFANAVDEDSECHGAGLIFQQTADLDLSSDDLTAGYLCPEFAGIYEGGEKSITLQITSPMSGAAMFGSLTGSASISDLTFNNIGISGGKDYCGVVAGRASGDVSFSNIKIYGEVSGHNNIGALVGYVTGGNITLSDITVGASVVGYSDYCGGLIGYVDSPKSLVLKECSVSSPVSGGNYVGGAFGRVNLSTSTGRVELNKLKIAYPFSKGGVKGNSYVGGFAGGWRWVLNKNISISNNVAVDIDVVGSQSEVGGLFGSVENAAINLDDFLVGEGDKTSQMSVSGVLNVGGVAGSMTNSSVYGWQYLDFEQNEKGHPVIPNPGKFKSSYNGSVKGVKNVGGLVGSMTDSQLLHLSCGANIAEGGENIGGFVGYFSGSSSAHCLEDCTFKGEINSSSAENVGGVAGYVLSTNEGLITDCINYGSIVGGYYTGGIVGYVRKEHDSTSDAGNMMEIDWAVNAAPVEGSYNVGGIAGRIYSAQTTIGGNGITVNEVSVANCMNAKDVIARGGNSEEALGGIVGRTGALTLVYRCANHGAIEGRGTLHSIGGIVGRLGQDANMGHSYYNSFATENLNTASINSTNREARVGGIVGYGEEGGEGYGMVYLCGVHNCRNSGKILPDQKDDTGGILGFGDNWIWIASNFNNGKVEHGNALLGTQKINGHQYWGHNYTLSGCGGSWPLDFTLILSSSQVTKQSNFIDFDFENVWEMTSDGPNLRNNKWRDPSSAKTDY